MSGRFLRYGSGSWDSAKDGGSSGFLSDWKNLGGSDPADGEQSWNWYRVIERSGRLPGGDGLIGTADDVLDDSDGPKRFMQVAIRANTVCVSGAANCTVATNIFTRGCTSQTSSLTKSSFMWHDHQKVSALSTWDHDCSGIGASGSNPTPVTLASFAARSRGSGVVFEWTTATEFANVGFYLLGETENGWKRLNDDLIPSNSAHSVVPQRYQVELEAGDAERFMLVDVNFKGSERRYGPYRLGQRHGSAVTPEPVDWAALGSEHRGKRSERLQQRGREIRDKFATVRAAASTTAALKASAGSGDFPIYEVRVDTDGLYRMTYEDLAAAGLDLDGVRSSELALTNLGEPVSLRVGGSQNGRFGPGGFLDFFGTAIDSLYTATNVYRLRVGDEFDSPNDSIFADGFESGDTTAWGDSDGDGDPGGDGGAARYYMERLVVDDNLDYNSASPTGDPWFNVQMLAFQGDPLSRDFALEVEDLADVGVDSELSLRLWGATDWPQAPDHHAVIEINGQQVADLTFDGLVDVPVNVTLPAGLIHEGSNTLRVTLPVDIGVAYDLTFVDNYSLHYPRRFVARDGGILVDTDARTFTVTNLPSDQVVAYRLDGGRLTHLTGLDVEPSGTGFAATVPGTGERATYVVASASAIPAPAIAAAPLIDDLYSGHAEYLVVSHPDFLDGLGGLIAAKHNQGLDVRVVSSEDVIHEFGYGIFGPDALRDYISFAADNLGTRYVLLVGADTYDYFDYLNLGSISFIPSPYVQTHQYAVFSPSDEVYANLDDDLAPDLMIGRFPVRSSAELEAIVEKTLAFPGPGAGSAVFAAGPTGLTSFAGASNDFADKLPASWTVDKAYVGQLGAAGARAALLGALDEGRALVSFFGHSGPTVWTVQEPYLFTAADAATMNNQGSPSLVTQWGCWNTYHVSPHYDTLAHKFLLSGEQGAAAVLGAASLTEASSENKLANLFFDRLFEPGRTIGEALRAAKTELAQSQPHLVDVLLGWTFLGDPAMEIDP